MDYLKQWLDEDGYAKYKEAKVLAEETSKTDPETDPYASKYKARDIWKSLKTKIEDFAEDSGCSNTTPISPDDIDVGISCETHISIKEVLTVDMLLTILNFDLANNFIECEEVTTGEEYLEKSLETALSHHQHTPYYNSVLVSINNQMSMIWSNRGQFEKSFEYLKAAEEIYKVSKSRGIDSPVNFNEVWREAVSDEAVVGEERKTFFESIHTLTLYYLAQVFLKLGKAGTAAKYCHITLVRQMETKQYDPKEWSLNCATLSQYYITQNQFTLSRYCLSCAEVVNQEAFTAFETQEFSEPNEKERAYEKVIKSKSDIYRCWAKYGLNLLQMSHAEKIGENVDGNLDDDSVDEDDKTYRDLRFSNLEVTVYEEQVTDAFATDYVSAKQLFSFSLGYLAKAKEFYKLDGYVTDFVEITQDTSQFYKYLAFFDDDFENRSKMHKRRIDMLNEILIQLNPKHFLQICRQLSFEIAETYSEMVYLKKAIVEEDPRKFSAHAVKKINYLIIQGIKYYTGFIDSYKRENELPPKFEDDDVRGVLLCFFCMARLNTKYCTNDRQTKINYLNKEKECYDFIIKYCDENPDMPKVFEEEAAVSREMAALFSGKMNSALNGLRN